MVPRAHAVAAGQQRSRAQTSARPHHRNIAQAGAQHLAQCGVTGPTCQPLVGMSDGLKFQMPTANGAALALRKNEHSGTRPPGTEPCVDNTVTMTAFSAAKRSMACSIQFTLAFHSMVYLSVDCPLGFVSATITATTEYAKDKGLP